MSLERPTKLRDIKVLVRKSHFTKQLNNSVFYYDNNGLLWFILKISDTYCVYYDVNTNLFGTFVLNNYAFHAYLLLCGVNGDWRHLQN
jgi:hypothetical protein